MHQKRMIKILSCVLIGVLLLLLAFSYHLLLSQPVSKKERTSITILTYKNIPLSILDGFHEQYPEYEIKVERYPKLNYLAFLDTKLVQEDSIDLIELPAEAYAEYVKADRVLPISSMALFTRIQSSTLDYLRELTGTSSYYGVPFQSNYLGVWYNVSLFKKYDLQPPDNLEHFLAACEVFSRENISPLAVGLSEDQAANRLLTLLTADAFASAPYPVSADSGFSDVDAPAYLHAFQRCYDMLEKGYLPQSCFYMTEPQAFEAFLNSSYAMALAPESSVAMINDSVLQQIDMNVCGFHVASGKTSTSVIGTPADSLLCISSSSKNPRICRMFLDYYTKYDTVLKYVKDTRTMTNIQSYHVDPRLSLSWMKIKENDCYIPEEHFYISAFVCDADTYALPRKLFYNLITPQEFIAELSP